MRTLYPMLFVILMIILMPVLWPILVILLAIIVIYGLILYWRGSKALRQAQSDYEKTDSQWAYRGTANPHGDVIDAEYSEKEIE